MDWKLEAVEASLMDESSSSETSLGGDSSDGVRGGMEMRLAFGFLLVDES